jgi:hypothetical protein
MEKIIEKKLGMLGTMISGSKSGYMEQYPDNLVVFNANLCTETGKVWYGDLDITKSSESLSALAIELNTTLYVLYEMDGRFEFENNPQLSRAIAIFYPDGEVKLLSRFFNLT